MTSIPFVEKKEKEIVLPKISDFATEIWWHAFRLLWVTMIHRLPTPDFLKAESQTLILSRSCFHQLHSLRLVCSCLFFAHNGEALQL